MLTMNSHEANGEIGKYLRHAILSAQDGPQGDVAKSGIIMDWLPAIGMHQAYSEYVVDWTFLSSVQAKMESGKRNKCCS